VLTPLGMHSPLEDPQPVGRTYVRTSRAKLGTAPLEGSKRADTVVVGAGFTGLSAALHLAQGGASVVVLEAKEAGAGGSGRTIRNPGGTETPPRTGCDPRMARARPAACQPWASRLGYAMSGTG